jgi:hypothetical protein
MKVIFLKKMLISTISSSRSKNKNKIFSWNFNCRILPYTTRRTCAKSFKKVDCTDCEIITFEEQRKVFFACAWQGQQIWTARGAKNLNYELLHHRNAHHVKVLECQILEVDDEWNIFKCTLY